MGFFGQLFGWIAAGGFLAGWAGQLADKSGIDFGKIFGANNPSETTQVANDTTQQQQLNDNSISAAEAPQTQNNPNNPITPEVASEAIGYVDPNKIQQGSDYGNTVPGGNSNSYGINA